MTLTKEDIMHIRKIFNDEKEDIIEFDENGFTDVGNIFMKSHHEIIRYDSHFEELYIPYSLKIENERYIYPMAKDGETHVNYWNDYRIIKIKNKEQIINACIELMEMCKDAKIKFKLEKLEKDFV